MSFVQVPGASVTQADAEPSRSEPLLDKSSAQRVTLTAFWASEEMLSWASVVDRATLPPLKSAGVVTSSKLGFGRRFGEAVVVVVGTVVDGGVVVVATAVVVGAVVGVAAEPVPATAWLTSSPYNALPSGPS